MCVVVGLLTFGSELPYHCGHLAFRHVGLPVLTVDGAPVEAASLLQRIAEILVLELHLPLPAQIAARVYDGRARFEQGLIADAAVPVARAAELSRFAAGVAFRGAVLLRAPVLQGEPSGDWPRLIAHELTHLAQIELAGRDGGPAQWLTECMAEWVAYRVVDRLGLGSLEDQEPLGRAAAIEYVRRTGDLDLDRLTTRGGFRATHQQVGTRLTYRLVLYLAATLVTRHGFGSLLDYFSAFRVSDDAVANFSVSFGTSVEGFERAGRATLAPSPPRADQAGAPWSAAS